MLVVLFYPTSAISTHVVDVNTNLFCILLYTDNDTFKSALFFLAQCSSYKLCVSFSNDSKS